MATPKQILTIGLWSLTVVLMVAMVASGLWPADQNASPARAPVVEAGSAPVVQAGQGGRVVEDSDELHVLFDVPTFAMTDQNEKPVSNIDLRGHLWVGAFLFTECPGICPAMSKQMARIQQTLAGLDVKIVSFSLDPDHDTPAVRRAYLEKIKGDASRWLFLAGPRDATYKLAGNFKIAAMPADGEVPIVHGEQVALVDREGRIRNYYLGTDPDAMKQLAVDAARLAKE